MNDFDVAVVGGRAAGASTALLLARAGLRVVVLERSSLGSDTLSTHALMRAGVMQLTRWGVLPNLVAAGTPAIRTTDFHYPDGTSTHVSLRSTGGVDALYAPRRYLLDRLLVEAAAAAGATVHHQTPVVGLLRDDDGRVVGVRARRPGGQETAIRTALTVGADGVRSLVAREVAPGFVRQGRAASAVLYRYVAGLPQEGYVWGYGDGAAAGLIPTNDGDACVFVSTTAAHMRSLRRSGAEGAFDILLEAVPAAVSDVVRVGRPVGRIRGWRGLPGYIKRPFGPGWALVGDAGYFRDPLSTHGLTDALRDAELLAGAVLDDAQDRTAGAVWGYASTRDRLSRALFEVTELISRYDWDADEIRSLLRRASAAMSDEVEHVSSHFPSPVIAG